MSQGDVQLICNIVTLDGKVTSIWTFQHMTGVSFPYEINVGRGKTFYLILLVTNRSWKWVKGFLK